MMSLHYSPIRVIPRMTKGAISWGQLEGLIVMFNGKFFKGLGIFRKEGKLKKQIRKQEQKEQELLRKHRENLQKQKRKVATKKGGK